MEGKTRIYQSSHARDNTIVISLSQCVRLVFCVILRTSPGRECVRAWSGGPQASACVGVLCVSTPPSSLFSFFRFIAKIFTSSTS